MLSLIEILNNCKYIIHNEYWIYFKFQYENKYYMIKINYNDENDNEFIKSSLVYNFLLPETKNIYNINSISRNNVYYTFDIEKRVHKLLNNINGEDINKNKIQICPKMYNNGIITDKKLIRLIYDIIKKYIKSQSLHLQFIHEFKYIIFDYYECMTLQDYIFNNNYISIDTNKFEEIHTYIFYLIYYFYLIHKQYDLYHNNLYFENILLSYDYEYDKNKIKYREIKINNKIYKVKIYPYIPIIIHFGYSSIFNKEIYSKYLWFLSLYNVEVKNKKFVIDKKYNIFMNFIKFIDEFVININYNDIDNYVNYFNKYKLNKLSNIFKSRKEYIELYNKYLINNKNIIITKKIDEYIYDNILSTLNNDDLLKFIERFKK